MSWPWRLSKTGQGGRHIPDRRPHQAEHRPSVGAQVDDGPEECAFDPVRVKVQMRNQVVCFA